MSNSAEISSRFWNQEHKGVEESQREETFIDDIIQKAHIEKEVLKNLTGVKTAFDGGAGSGRFSILLAKMGLDVTHFDISLSMIDKAKETAAAAGVLDRMTFVQGELENLDAYNDGQFDLVISFDAPISYTYPNQENVIANLIRIADKKIIISVASLTGWIPYMFNPAQKAQYILDHNADNPYIRWYIDEAAGILNKFTPDMKAVRKIYESHELNDLDEMMALHREGVVQWPHTYAFTPDELQNIMERNGAINIHLTGPGALSRAIPNEVLINIMKDQNLRKDFLDFCYEYDSNLWCAGMGKDNLVASADI